MLKPAILFKDEIEKKFAEVLYTENYFYYTGYAGCNTLPEIRTQDEYYQFAIVDGDDKVYGYLAYHIDPGTDTVSRFGLYSFVPGNMLLGRDVFNKLEELVSYHRRVEWRVIGGNPVIKHYDKFCEKHSGNKVTLHSVTRDLSGNYRDEHIYEIVNNG